MFANTTMGGLNVGSPDVCYTPSIIGPPTPVAHTNVASPPTGFPVADSVLFMNAPAHNLSTVIPITNGAEAGVNGGLGSGTVMGPSRYVSAASSVLVDGSPVARLGSSTLTNSTNCAGATVVPSQLKVVVLAP